MGLEDYWTCTEDSDSSEEGDEVTHLDRTLCFLLSECVLGLTKETRSDCSDLIPSQTETNKCKTR